MTWRCTGTALFPFLERRVFAREGSSAHVARRRHGWTCHILEVLQAYVYMQGRFGAGIRCLCEDAAV